MTPLHLEILVYANGMADDLPNADSIAVREYRAELRRSGILDNQSPPRLTPKGQAWLGMILATPMPVHRWADPRKDAEGCKAMQRAAEAQKRLDREAKNLEELGVEGES